MLAPALCGFWLLATATPLPYRIVFSVVRHRGAALFCLENGATKQIAHFGARLAVNWEHSALLVKEYRLGGKRLILRSTRPTGTKMTPLSVPRNWNPEFWSADGIVGVTQLRDGSIRTVQYAINGKKIRTTFVDPFSNTRAMCRLLPGWVSRSVTRLGSRLGGDDLWRLSNLTSISQSITPLFDEEAGADIARVAGHPRWLVVRGKTIQIFDDLSGGIRLKSKFIAGPGQIIMEASFSPDGTQIVLVLADSKKPLDRWVPLSGQIFVFDLARKTCKNLGLEATWVRAIS